MHTDRTTLSSCSDCKATRGTLHQRDGVCTRVHRVHVHSRECSWQKWHSPCGNFSGVHIFFEGPPGECTLFLRVLKESAHMFSVVCTEYSGPAPRCALLFVRSAQVFGRPVHFASSVHSFLLPSAPPISAPGPGSGPGGRARGVGGGGSGEDSFPVNPGVAALWHPRAATAATTTVKVVTGGGQVEERPAP